MDGRRRCPACGTTRRTTRADRALIIGRDRPLAELQDAYTRRALGSRPWCSSVVVRAWARRRSSDTSSSSDRARLDRARRSLLRAGVGARTRRSIAVIDALSRALLRLPIIGGRGGASARRRRARAVVSGAPARRRDRRGSAPRHERRRSAAAPPARLRRSSRAPARASPIDAPLRRVHRRRAVGRRRQRGAPRRVLRPPDPPPLLLIAACRSDDAPRSSSRADRVARDGTTGRPVASWISALTEDPTRLALYRVRSTGARRLARTSPTSRAAAHSWPSVRASRRDRRQTDTPRRRRPRPRVVAPRCLPPTDDGDRVQRPVYSAAVAEAAAEIVAVERAPSGSSGGTTRAHTRGATTGARSSRITIASERRSSPNSTADRGVPLPSPARRRVGAIGAGAARDVGDSLRGCGRRGASDRVCGEGREEGRGDTRLRPGRGVLLAAGSPRQPDHQRRWLSRSATRW